MNKFGRNFEIIFVKFLKDCRRILKKSWKIVGKIFERLIKFFKYFGTALKNSKTKVNF